MKFYTCDFSEIDKTEAQFINCHFRNQDKSVGSDFIGKTLKEAGVVNSDLTMSTFMNANLFGIEISACLSIRSAFITRSNLIFRRNAGGM